MSERFADSAGRYRLDSRIATGGMGEVWRATDTLLGREVAVKLLKHEYADDETFRSRFQAEARHAASLHHPGVASVFDFGEVTPEDGSPRPYLVMELVDGQPLSELLRSGEPMPPERARGLIGQAAEAIAAAHTVGIVHRDVKPANLMVTPDGVVKITDFGIARAAESVSLTQTGQVIGTPHYLSPEQASGQTATQASDVYSLGVVLFECLAGHRPFQGENAIATALAHLRDPIPELPEHVPADLRAIVRRTLAKEPSERYASAGELAAALKNPAAVAGEGLAAGALGATAATEVLSPATAVMTAPPMPAPVPPAAPRRRWQDRLPSWWPVAAAALLVILVIAGLAWALGDASTNTGADTGKNPAASSPGAASTTPSKETSSPPPDNRVRVRESDYVGRPKDEVKKELEDLGFKVEEQKRSNPGTELPDTVAEIRPHGLVEPESTLNMVVWDKPVVDEHGKGKAKGREKD